MFYVSSALGVLMDHSLRPDSNKLYRSVMQWVGSIFKHFISFSPVYHCNMRLNCPKIYLKVTIILCAIEHILFSSLLSEYCNAP